MIVIILLSSISNAERSRFSDRSSSFAPCTQRIAKKCVNTNSAVEAATRVPFLGTANGENQHKMLGRNKSNSNAMVA